jgi:hypothetical protein
MPTYERVLDGEVVERVQPIEGDYEDTRLGLLAMEDGGEWRIAATNHIPPASASTPDPSDKSSQQKRK